MYINVSNKPPASLIRSRVDLSLNGHPLGVKEITRTGWQTLHWIIPVEPAGPAEVTFDVSPPTPADVPMGVAVGALGFR